MTLLNPSGWDLESLWDPAGPTTARGRQWAVGSLHPLSTEAGRRALQAGGTAADAFVAMCAVEHVVMPGTATLGATFGAVYHDGRTATTHAVNAGMNAPLADDQPYVHVEHRLTGRAVMVPGVIKGLEVLWQRFGRLPWADLLEPALMLAEEGFVVWPGWVAAASHQFEALVRHEGGRANFAPNGSLPAAGDRLRQAPLARSLRELAAQGAAYCYEGDWAEQLVAGVRDLGGLMAMEDLARYEVRVEEPLVGQAWGREVRTLVPPQNGGLLTLAGLHILEAMGERPSRNVSAQTLKQDIHAFLRCFPGPSQAILDFATATPAEREAALELLSDEYAKATAEEILAGEPAPGRGRSGIHSHNLTIADADGSMLAAVFTTYSNSFGDTGLVVGGIAMNSSAYTFDYYRPAPGGRLIEPFAPLVVVDDGQPVLAASTIGTGVIACQMQTISNVLAEGDDVITANDRARFGATGVNITTMERSDKVYLDLAFDPSMVEELEALGQPAFQTAGDLTHFADPGNWMAIQRDPADGALTVVVDHRSIGKAAAAG